MTQPIGIFDSGIGGLSVLKALRGELPNEHFIYIADSGHAPYGERDDAHVIERSQKIATYLVKQNTKALVVACNTATAAAIDVLRATYPNLPIIGVEPALKPAVALSKTKRIAVMATRSTLTSARFAALLAAQAGQARFTLLPCDGLAEAIEQSAQTFSPTPDATELIASCSRIMGAKNTFNAKRDGATPIDTIVLGCTHYAFAAQHIATLAGAGVQLLDTAAAVARQAQRVLQAAQAMQAAHAAQLLTNVQPGIQNSGAAADGSLPALSSLDAPYALDALSALGALGAQNKPAAANQQTTSWSSAQGEQPPLDLACCINFISTGNPAVLRNAAAAWMGLTVHVNALFI